ncbi:hypothetical protein BN946_scf185015.g109 [Trametes cinnabarina]|uniref:Tyrosine specific protein phosphatases domain-containing protein n=1 Tax=Pycnoporus cinnabarinus TaxID=5643 RepID=A0A060SHX6_PYCCI|nr:hypothetical protein BN946_scf185015.g109 [Trametes cinnabarina]
MRILSHSVQYYLLLTMDLLDPLDPGYIAEQLSRPPFVTIPGVVNVRDLGSYPTSSPGLVTRPGLVYRSGEISHITPEGMQKLRQLGITTIYDLRSETEMHRYETPIPTIEGVEVVHIPVFKTEDYSPEAMAKRFELYASGKTETGFALYVPLYGWKGQDRDPRSYTSKGREPAREMIMRRLSKVPFFADNMEAALNMFSSRAETMIAFLKLLDERYGGVEGYVKNVVRLTDDDIANIRKNFIVPAPQSEVPAKSGPDAPPQS